MYYLFSFNVTGWLSEGLEKVAGAARQVLNTLCYTLDTVIYKLIINLYNLFELLCTSRIVSIDEFSDLSKRIGFILGIIMLFRVVFSFIQMLLNPDIISDKEKGAVSIVKKCVIVIVMLGMSSFAFNFLHSIQTNVVKNHIISRLLLPKSIDTDNFGAVLSEQVLLNFYVLNENLEGEEIYDHCENYINGLRNQIITNSNFELGHNCLNETVVMSINTAGSYEDQEVFVIDFNNILSVIVGGAIVWLLFRYCISVGVRVIQLTILEIISPMPIIAYLAPGKDSMFDKWKKMYFSTYIDAFIRIAIINFIIYICAVILDNWKNSLGTFWESVGSPTDPYTKGFIGIVMILALLTFAKKAPELLKDLLPKSESKLGFGFGMKDVVGLQRGMRTVTGAGAASAVGLIGGIAGGKGLSRFTGAIGGVLGGALRGGKAGFGAKGIGTAISSAGSNQAKVNLARAQRIAAGSSFGERVEDSIRNTFGIQSGYDTLNAELSMSNSIKDTLSNDDIIKHIREVRQSYIQSCASSGTTADVRKLAAYDNAEKEALRQMYAFAHNNDNGSTYVHVEDTSIGLNLTEEYKTNRGIYNQIKANEKRAGQKLATYDNQNVDVYDAAGTRISTITASSNNWKSNNNDLKTKIADKTKTSK